MIHHRALRLFGALLIPLLGAALGAGPAQAQQRGGTMVMIVQPEPATLASYLSVAGNICPVACQVYEGLVTYDWSLKPQPEAGEVLGHRAGRADHHLPPAGRRHLPQRRPRSPAPTCQYSFMQVLKKVHPRAPVVLHDLVSVDTPDPMTAVFHLSHPAPYLMMALSGYDAPILSKGVFENTDPAANPSANKPIGTGPFKFGAWERGQYIRLDRNPHYWKPGLPYLDRIVARFIPDASTRSAALEAGEVQYAAYSSVNYADIKRLQAVPSLDTTTKGYRDDVGHLRDRDERAPAAVRQARGAPGHCLRDRPQVHHRQRAVRLRQAGHRPDQLQLRGVRPVHGRCPALRRARPRRDRQQAAGRGRAAA